MKYILFSGLILMSFGMTSNSPNSKVAVLNDASTYRDMPKGKALTNTEMQYFSQSNNAVVNFVGDLTDIHTNDAKAALKFSLPATTSPITRAELHLKVVDIQDNPSVSIALAKDNHWQQTDEVNSTFPSISKVINLTNNVSVAAKDWNTIELSADVLTKCINAKTREITLVVSDSDQNPNSYFSFVADDDASGNKAYIVFYYN
jgi:hypothetical protein